MTEFHINDLFWTLQGEGQFTGRRALFIRLPYCNYDCPWCDTEYDSFKKIPKDELMAVMKAEPSRFAVITGGEPMAHKHLLPLLNLLKEQGFEVACETNGSLPIPEEIDHPTISPKAFTKGKYPAYFVHPDNHSKVKEWKYVVDQDFDFSILSRHKPLNPKIRHSLSPEFNQMSSQVARIITYIQKNPEWRLSLQTHKWIDIP